MTDPLVAHHLAAVPTDEMTAMVARLAALDRYQASEGIDRAAELVATAAVRAGLSDVRVDRYVADGTARWWTFDAPTGWTPHRATLHVDGPDGLALDHATHPFLVATYSASTPPAGLTAPLVAFRPDASTTELAGALLVVDRDTFRDGSLLPRLGAAGAVGFVTDAPWRDDGGTARRGRIELPAGSPLLAFSLTPEEFVAAGRLAGRRSVARVHVEVADGAPMPVVSGLLPGDGDQAEVWMMAHLCHPRPSANDNASGVAAALAAARTLAAARRSDPGRGGRRPVRFFWGPEFVGTAAVLHDRRHDPVPPAAVINLDMVGEDQLRCAAPFVVERPPDCHPTLLTPLAEHVVAETFAATAAGGGTWGSVPFQGFSDHALFADPGVRVPAVQFCHPADRFNHSAADTVDKVSPLEMRRSAAAAAALAQLCAGPDREGPDLAALVDRWCAREEADAVRLAGRYDRDWGDGLVAHVRRTNLDHRLLVGDPGPDRRSGTGPTRPAGAEPAPPPGTGPTQFPGARPGRPPGGADGTGFRRDPAGPVLRRRWTGPLNLRAAQAALPAPTRALLAGLVARDKHTLSTLFNLAIRADGTRDAGQLVEDTSYGLRRPIDPTTGHRLVDVLCEAGWLAAD
ncbi:DUF4910 domain-containing protein [Micromonospora cathayae]|uniref:DUF4910 domain-containing protein n=1 Tax=Micromonospora cathayae TaxID=3028804 RepID=A0ABY7ZS40_9ACTN|nr:DUF4910 domain-containing protein [Micromonospora sp. HUAS 3]WDZ85849.1 DUF4910 domain-containing protein [Micromonospora sp. HUAS 3]